MSDARGVLKAAAREVSEVETQIAQLETAMRRAEKMAQDAQAELAKYRGLDTEIVQWRVRQVKQGADTKTLPVALKTRVEAKRTATEELEQAQSTQEALGEELEAAKARLQPAQAVIQKAAIALLHHEADSLAQELMKLNSRSYELRQKLEGLAAMEAPDSFGRPVAIGQTAQMAEALNGFRLDFPQRCDPVWAMAKRWRKRLDAVMEDHEAAITVPKPVSPSDFIFKSEEHKGPGFQMPQVDVFLAEED
jgi:predicted RNase H-like nuclease (RuvC/YqgF family)